MTAVGRARELGADKSTPAAKAIARRMAAKKAAATRAAQKWAAEKKAR